MKPTSWPLNFTYIFEKNLNFLNWILITCCRYLVTSSTTYDWMMLWNICWNSWIVCFLLPDGCPQSIEVSTNCCLILENIILFSLSFSPIFFPLSLQSVLCLTVRGNIKRELSLGNLRALHLVVESIYFFYAIYCTSWLVFFFMLILRIKYQVCQEGKALAIPYHFTGCVWGDQF